MRKFQLVVKGPVQIFKSLHRNRFIFEKISALDKRGSSNFQITSTKPLYFQKTSARDNKDKSNFQNLQQNCFIFQNISARDNRGRSIFKSLQQNRFILRKFQLVIIGAVQIFKTPDQNCFIVQQISARDYSRSISFQNTSTKLLYFCENFSS